MSEQDLKDQALALQKKLEGLIADAPELKIDAKTYSWMEKLAGIIGANVKNLDEARFIANASDLADDKERVTKKESVVQRNIYQAKNLLQKYDNIRQGSEERIKDTPTITKGKPSKAYKRIEEGKRKGELMTSFIKNIIDAMEGEPIEETLETLDCVTRALAQSRKEPMGVERSVKTIQQI